MKKICVLVTNSLTLKDGIGRNISNMAYYFKEKMIILTNKYIENSTYTFPNETKIYTNLRTSHGFFSSWILPINYLIMIKLLKRENIYVLNPHSLGGLLFCSILKLISNQKVRLSAFIYDREDLVQNIRKKIILKILNFFCRHSIINEIIVLDKKMKNVVKKKLQCKIHIVRVGVSPSLLYLAKKYSTAKVYKKKKEFKLLFHGILIPRRRVEDIIYAIYQLRNVINVKLFISGSRVCNKEYVKYLDSLINKLGLKNRIIFLGPLSDRELAQMYTFCDVFIFPCHKQTWGVAPLEAMLFGTPVIVSKTTGVSEVLKNNCTALLISPKKPSEIEKAVLRLYRNEKLYKRLAKNGKFFVMKHMTYLNTGRQLSRIWKLKEKVRAEFSTT